MYLKILGRRMLRLALAGAVCLFAAAPAAKAEFRLFGFMRQDSCRDPRGTFVPGTSPETIPGTIPGTNPDSPVPSAQDPSLRPVTTAALGDNVTSFGPGYLDNAVPFTHFRLRFDSAYRNNRPDRAEYFYAKCGCFGGNAPGPIRPETRVDYQDVAAYFEYATSERLSLFIEFPFRFLNPDNNANTSGLADMNAGFKYAIYSDESRILTFQGRVYIPSGDADRGLGTNHVSLEPSLLYAQNLTDRLVLFGQFGDYIPVGGTDFSGNILRYGVGLSYSALNTGSIRVAPVAELLGWTVLSGKEFAFPENTIRDASGDTIVNAKFGVRLGFGGSCNRGILSNSDLYIGYGRALTGEVWYKDMLRIEYRMRF